MFCVRLSNVFMVSLVIVIEIIAVYVLYSIDGHQ